MSDIFLNYRSGRSYKARIGVKLGRKWITLLYLLSVVLLLVGLLLVVVNSIYGWLLAGLAFIPAMIVEWQKRELSYLPVAKNPKSIDDLLSGEILGRLTNKPTPKDLATIVGTSSGGNFFAVRFGLGAKFLQEISSPNQEDMDKIWKTAIDLRDKLGSNYLSSAILVASLIKSFPGSKNLLGRLQLDFEDILNGVRWYDRLQDIINRHYTPRRTGGLARDWSFGWTSLLDRFAQNISKQFSGKAGLLQLSAHNEVLDQLVDIFSRDGKQNAVLIGPLGSGKTEVVVAFAAKLMDASANISTKLRFRQVLLLDAAALISSAPDRGGLERLVPSIFSEAYSAKNVIVCLDNAQLFFEDGVGSIDISNILLPILSAGSLRIILTMDEQQYLALSKRKPEMASALNRITITPASRNETMAIMEERIIVLEYQNKVRFMYQALSEAYRLSERYVYDLAMPGKALKVLESAIQYAESGFVTVNSIHQAVENTFAVKVGVADSDEERNRLLNLENLIHERMINQKRAVQVVSDALRRARAGVRNQNRPIGTFLFLGPTGVGKTELAKSLATIYFGGENRLIRLDMNEYVSSDDVRRLIADGSNVTNSLTAQVMKQPFSVILLDEIEKAHPDVLSTLLQMLDEGVLRDERNREVSFRDAIIIATSNAGAERIREYIERGYDITQFEQKFVDELINNREFRPEFLNRFDEIILFRPLNQNELLAVVDLLLKDVNKTLSMQKITVEVSDDAKKYLVELGYDPKMGARPMRRVVQRVVENLVAKMMLTGEIEAGSVVKLDLDQIKKSVETRNTAQKIIDEN